MEHKQNANPSDSDVPFPFLTGKPLMRSFQPAAAASGTLSLEEPIFRSVGVSHQFEPVVKRTFGTEEFWESAGPSVPLQGHAKSLDSLIPLPSFGSQLAGKGQRFGSVGKSLQSQLPLDFSGPIALPIPQEAAHPRAPVPPLPAWVEPTSFPTTDHEVLDNICRVLENDQVHYSFKPHKNKIKGVVFDKAVPCHFLVKLFARDAKSSLVEFQRRSGCIMVFNSLFRRVRAALSGEQAQSQQQSLNELSPTAMFLDVPAPAAFASASPAFDCSDLDRGVQLDHDTLAVLCSLVSSPCIDTQRDAARTLAHLSACPNNASALADSIAQAAPSPLATPTATPCKVPGDLLELIQSLLCAKDREVARCGAALLANLSKAESARAPLLNKTLTTALRLIDPAAACGSVAADTTRQCALALDNFAASHAPTVTAQLQRCKELKRALAALEGLQTSKDRTCREAAARALSNLVLVGVPC